MLDDEPAVQPQLRRIMQCEICPFQQLDLDQIPSSRPLHNGTRHQHPAAWNKLGKDCTC